MVVHYSDINRLPPEREQGAIFHADPDELLGHVDVLTLHMPGGAETARS